MDRLLFGVALVCLFPGTFSAFIKYGNAVLQQRPGWLLPFVIGTVLGILFDTGVIRKSSALHTFRHELGHAFAALIFFRRVDRFVVTRHKGGEVYHSAGFGGALADDVIGLAPYTIPTFYFISVLLRPVLPPGWFPWVDVWIGFTFGFHLWGGIRDIRRNYSKKPFIGASSRRKRVTDIASTGFIFSFIYIVTVSLAIHGILLAVMLNGYTGVLSWAHEFWAVTQHLPEFVSRMVALAK